MRNLSAFDWKATYKRLLAQLDKSSDSEIRERYALDCAVLLARRLNDTDAAIELLIRVGTQRPTVRLAERLALLYLETNDYSSAYDWLLEAVEMSEGDELQRLRVRLARLAVDHLERPMEALAALRAYMDDGGSDVQVLRSLLGLARGTDSTICLEVMDRLIELLPDAEARIPIREQYILLAEVAELRVSDAVDHFKHEDMHQGASREVVFAAYRLALREGMLEEFKEAMREREMDISDLEGKESSVDEQIVDDYPSSAVESSLVGLLKLDVSESLRSWVQAHYSLFGARLVPLLEVLADTLQDNRNECVELALQLSIDEVDHDVWPTTVFGLLADALCEHGATRGLRVKAEQLGGRFPRLKHLAFALAGFEALQSQELTRARECFELADQIQPLGRAEARALRYISWQLGDLEQVRGSIERELEGVPKAAQRDLLVELALLDDRGGNLERAEAYYQTVVRTNGPWLPASYGLGTLLDRQGRWRELAYIVDEELREVSEGSRADLALVGRLAEIYEHHLDQLDEAATLYEKVRVLKPSAPDAILGLSRIYERQGRWEALVELLESLAEVYATPRSRAYALYQAGELEQYRVGNLNAAASFYRRAFELFPENLFAWALEAVALKNQDRNELFLLYTTANETVFPNLDVRKALTLAPTEAFGPIERLMDTRGGVLWSLLFTQLTCELQRRDLVGIGLEALAKSLPTIDEREGLFLQAMYEAEAVFDDVSSQRLFEQIDAFGPAAIFGWQLRHVTATRETNRHDLLQLCEWLPPSILTPDEGSAISALRFILEMESEGVSTALEKLAERTGSPNSDPVWLDHVLALSTISNEVNIDRKAASMLRLAGLYSGTEEASVKAYSAGRLFERSNALAQAVESYRWAIEQDASMVAAVERLIDLIGVAVTQSNAWRIVREAIVTCDSEAHRVHLLRLSLSILERYEPDENLEFEVMGELFALNGIEGHLQRFAELLLKRGEHSRAITCLKTLADTSEDLDAIVWSASQLGMVFLSTEQFDEAIEYLRRAVALREDVVTLSGLSLAYLKNRQYELARLSYERLEGLEAEDASDVEARLGRMVSLQMVGRLEAAMAVGNFEATNVVNARCRLLITQMEPELRAALPLQLQSLGMQLTPQPLFRPSGSWKSSTDGDWLDAEEPEEQDSIPIESVWRVQRQAWLSGSLVTTPVFTRQSGVLNHRLMENLLPEGIHPALVDSLTLFCQFNDPFFTDTSGPIAPLSDDELMRLSSVADSLSVTPFEVRLDTVNPFRVDCRSGENACVIIGHDLFESLTLDQMEFLFAWCFAVIRLGAMPPTFMRAARRFGTEEFSSVLGWIQKVAIGADHTTGQPLVNWSGSEAVRRRMMDVLEWVEATQRISLASVYQGLQLYGLRLALALAPSYGVAMETMRLIEMDDRSLDNLEPSELRASVERNALLKDLDGFAQSETCIQARLSLFTLS